MRLALALSLAAACAAQVHQAAPELDRIVPPGAQVEKLAGDFGFTEGPLWMRGGFLIFSDIPKQVIRRWNPDGAVSVFRESSNGANGLALDREGRVVACEQLGRRLVRYERDGKLTVLAERYEGKHLNSPNDVVCRSDGSLYFTDPPYGLPKQDADPAKELAFNGVYRLAKGKLQLLHKELTRPNGIAFSPDEKVLYVANSDGKRKIWMRFDVRRDGALANGSVFYDATSVTAPGGPDGMKVDTAGNLYCTGPGGIWIFSPAARHLGTIQFPETPANCAWGGTDGKTLYVTARTGLYRIRLNIAGPRAR
ncbi:MAG: SMP-30/gluconolactonase/LRE family protein [Bryobacteraceae bacterium]